MYTQNFESYCQLQGYDGVADMLNGTELDELQDKLAGERTKDGAKTLYVYFSVCWYNNKKNRIETMNGKMFPSLLSTELLSRGVRVAPILRMKGML